MRFARTVDSIVYRVVSKVAGQDFAYRLVDPHHPDKVPDFTQPVSRRMLIKLDMPELDSYSPSVDKQRVEAYDEGKRMWRKATVEALALD